MIAAADSSSLSLGVEGGHYEGPLRLRIPVRLSPAAAGDGGWSFELPLPDPASQKLLGRCGPGMLGHPRPQTVHKRIDMVRNTR